MGKCRRVYCITNHTWYPSMKECAQILSISTSSINDSIRDGKPHMGYQFSYEEIDITYVDPDEHEALQLIKDDSRVWKDVVGYEELYEVSNLGNVRSLHWYGGDKVVELKKIKHPMGYLAVNFNRKDAEK